MLEINKKCKSWLFREHIGNLLPLLLGIVGVLLYVLPWILAGESGYIKIHDGLDSNMVWHTILAKYKVWFEPSMALVGPIGEHGMPRISYPSELHIVTWFFAFMKPYWAYVANQFLFRSLAFIGMYVFLQNIIQSNQRLQSLIIFGVSLCFAYLPVWSWMGGEIAVLPFVFYAIFRILNGHLRIVEVIILIAAPFYSNTVLTGMFIIGIFWLLVLLRFITRHHVHLLIIGAIITTAGHIITDYRLWIYLFSEGMVSHRVDFVTLGHSSFVAWANAKKIFFDGYWPATHHNLIILKIISIALIMLCLQFIWARFHPSVVSYLEKLEVWKKRLLFGLASLLVISVAKSIYSIFFNLSTVITFREAFPSQVVFKIMGVTLIFICGYFIWLRIKAKVTPKLENAVSWRQSLSLIFPTLIRGELQKGLALVLSILFILCIVISLSSAFWGWSTVVSFRRITPILTQIDFTTITLFLPFIWMVMFALSLILIARIIPSVGIVIVILAISMQLKLELDKHEYLVEKKQSGLTFRQFYSEDLFKQISGILPNDKNSYLVGAIGIHPSVLQYNGFRTAGGYLGLYPKKYKLKFRRAVIQEFSKREDLLSYFDNWGSRFYFFTSEMLCPRRANICLKKHGPQVVKHLDFDIQATRALGVEYFFSLANISNANELGLKTIGTYTDKNSAWSITVYSLLGQ